MFQGTGELKIEDEILGDTTIPDLRYTVFLLDDPDNESDAVRILIQEKDGGAVIFDNQRNGGGSSPPLDAAVNIITGAITDGEIKFEDFDDDD